MGCEHNKRRLVRIVPPIAGLWHCYTHNSCVCNDEVAMRNRVLGVVPLPTEGGVVSLAWMLRKLWPHRAITPLTLERALESFKGTRRALYLRAYDSLQSDPLKKRDSRISAFVKAEKFCVVDKVNPDPRMIQARTPRYNLHLARFLRPLEHQIYGLKRHGLPVIAKCLNPKQRAKLIVDKWQLFRKPVCFSIDCSRWDKHVSREILDVEHGFYQDWFKGDLELKQLLEWQKVNRCRTSNGVKYTVNGGRMSGDMNTALGNCVLMVGMVTDALERVVGHYAIIDDGDDCLVFVEEDDFERVAAFLPARFLEYGQELKIENVARDLQDIIFCQCRLTLGADGWTMARDWHKVLSQSCCGTRHWNDPNMIPAMFGMLGDCENALHRGVPILQAFATRLRELSGGKRARITHMDSSYQYRIGSYGLEDVLSLEPAIVTEEARFEFERTWGTPIWQQLAVEHHLTTWEPFAPMRDVPSEIDHRWSHTLDVNIGNPSLL